jgi:hypothetical protein
MKWLHLELLPNMGKNCSWIERLLVQLPVMTVSEVYNKPRYHIQIICHPHHRKFISKVRGRVKAWIRVRRRLR